MQNPVSGKTVLRSWLLSSALLVLVPILVSIVIYLQAFRVVQQEINRSNTAVLRQAVTAVDGRLEAVQSLSVSILFEQSVNMLIRDDSADAIRRHYDLVRQTVNDLKTDALTGSYIYNAYIHLARSDTVLTPNGLETADSFYHDAIQRGFLFRDHLGYEAWRRLLSGAYEGDYLVLGGTGAEVAEVFLRSLPVYGHQGTLIVALDSSKLYDGLQGVGALNGAWGVVLDERDNVLFSTRPLPDTLPAAYASLRGASGITRGRIGREDYTISYLTSSVERWKYLSIMPTRVYNQRLSSMRTFIIAGTLAGLLLGALLALYLSRRNYGPVNALVQDLTRRTGRQAGKGRNEFAFIQDTVDDTLDENAKIAEILWRQNDALRQAFLVRLLKGDVDDENLVTKAMETFPVRFESDRFAVVLLYIVDLGRLSVHSDAGGHIGDLLKARQLVGATVEAEVSRKHRGYATEADGMLACILNLLGTEETEHARDAVEAANRAIAALRKEHGITVTAAVSDVHESVAGIAAAYREALDAMGYKRALDIEETIRYAQVKNARGSYDYPIEIEHQLFNCMKAGETADAVSIVTEVFARNLTQGEPSREMVTCLTFDLAGTVLKVVSELEPLGADRALEGAEVARRLLGCERIHDMQGEMTRIVTEICDAVRTRRKPRRDVLVDHVAQFVAASYQDPGLSVASIARHFHVTRNYLIELFRGQAGEGVYHRITRLRMEKARQLLRTEGASIKSVASDVGYCSAAAFIRAFKRSEGVTPGSFKEMEPADPGSTCPAPSLTGPGGEAGGRRVTL